MMTQTLTALKKTNKETETEKDIVEKFKHDSDRRKKARK